MFDPHPVSCLEGQHRQVGPCFVGVTTTPIVSHSPDFCCSVQHNVHINNLRTITLDVDKEDIHPCHGSSEHPVTRVVSVANVCDYSGEYQGTAAPGTAG